MENNIGKKPPDCTLTEDDLRAAVKEMKSYVDVTEEDLKKIYEIALRHARERTTLDIPVKELMTTRVVSVSKNADLHEAARLLSENRISGMPVVDETGRVAGVISEADILMLAGMHEGHTFRDILRRVLGEQVPQRKTGKTVAEVMSSPPITAKTDDAVKEVARILDERRIKRLPVVDDEGHLLGIVSRADIVRAIGQK